MTYNSLYLPQHQGQGLAPLRHLVNVDQLNE